MEGGIAAAQAGHDVVMTPTSNTYFDYYQSRNTAAEPLAIGGFLPLETVYAFEPVPAGFDSVQAAHILGTQGQIWTEYQRNPKNVEYMGVPAPRGARRGGVDVAGTEETSRLSRLAWRRTSRGWACSM